MNDFAAMMAATGTRRLGEHGVQPMRTAPPARRQVPAPPPMKPMAPTWAIGAEGLAVLERAMRGISRNGALARPNGQIMMLIRKKDGTLVDAGDPPGVVTPDDILKLADRLACEMIIISWSGRKAVFHPASGAAVLTEDLKGA